MKAIVQTAYGTPDVLARQDLPRPTVGEDQVLVQVHAAGLHAGDVFTLRGRPWLVRLFAGWPRPKNYIPGFDAAGRVAAVGNRVAQFRPGDAVYGACTGTCAEFVSAAEKYWLPMPVGLTFSEAAAVPTSGLTALVGLRDAGKLQPGQRVLINGASGGVGTFAVQIAKAVGAKVTGVCSPRKQDLVRSLGADHVIDYTREDFTKGDRRYDLIFDLAASHRLSDCRRVLTPTGIHIPNSGRGGMTWMFRALLASLVMHRQGRPFMVTPDGAKLAALNDFLVNGTVRPVVDRTFPLSQTAAAFRYLDAGLARGKVVVMVSDDHRSQQQETSSLGEFMR